MGSVIIPKCSQRTSCNVQYNVSGVYWVRLSELPNYRYTNVHKMCSILRLVIQILRSCRPLSTGHCVPFTRCCAPSTVHCSALYRLLGTVYCSLSTVHSSVPTDNCPQCTLARHCLVFIVHSPLSALRSPLPTGHCTLSTGHSPVSTVYCLPSYVHCQLPISHSTLSTVHHLVSTAHCPVFTNNVFLSVQ